MVNLVISLDRKAVNFLWKISHGCSFQNYVSSFLEDGSLWINVLPSENSRHTGNIYQTLCLLSRKVIRELERFKKTKERNIKTKREEKEGP
jgi:hypothetical protein